jgi:hypothetical protein
MPMSFSAAAFIAAQSTEPPPPGFEVAAGGVVDPLELEVGPGAAPPQPASTTTENTRLATVVFMRGS